MPIDTNRTEDTLFDQITEAIDENGTLTESTRKRLMLMAMREIYSNTKCIPDLKGSIKELQRKNIVMWIEKHPKGAITIAVLLFTVMPIVIDKVLPILGFK